MLAALLNLPFMDLDAYIEKKENKPIPVIFETTGESTFREIETAALSDLLQLKSPHVISLGGGTVCFNGNLKCIKNNGYLIYIQHTVVTLTRRIQESDSKRPLLKNLSQEELSKTIEQLLAERRGFYEQAHIIVNGLDVTPQRIHQKLIDFVKGHAQ